MDHPVTDRRRDARFGPDAVPDVRATLRPGCVVAIVNLSAGGALVEAPRPLRPGGRVQVQLVTGRDTISINAHILRCAVWALHPEHGVVYRGALRFEQPCGLVG